jgi:hypothetical protein
MGRTRYSLGIFHKSFNIFHTMQDFHLKKLEKIVKSTIWGKYPGRNIILNRLWDQSAQCSEILSKIAVYLISNYFQFNKIFTNHLYCNCTKI